MYVYMHMYHYITSLVTSIPWSTLHLHLEGTTKVGKKMIGALAISYITMATFEWAGCV